MAFQQMSNHIMVCTTYTQDYLSIQKKRKSRSWYAAGYYMLTIGRKSKVVFCPKLILLERYGYFGPVKEADGFYYK